MISKFLYIFEGSQKRKFFLLFVMIIIGAFAELLGVTAVLPFIQLVLDGEAILNNPYMAKAYSGLGFSDVSAFLVFLALLIVGVYIVKNVYVYVMHSMQYQFTYDNQKRLSTQMLDCYLNQPYLYHVHHNRAELIRNAGDDVRAFFEVVLATLQLASEGSVCLVLLTFLLIQDIGITLGVIALVSAFALVYLKIFKKKLKRAGDMSRDNQENYQRIMLEALGSIKEVKVSGAENFFLRKFEIQAAGYAENNRKFKQYGMLPKPVMETCCISGLLLVIAFKLMAGNDAREFIPTMTMFAVAAFRMLPSANRMAEYLSRIFFSKPSIDAIYKDLHEVRALQKSDSYKKRNLKKIDFNKEISLDGVTFRYPAGDRNILDNVSISIPKNKAVALIGPTGQGKTTTADLILGILAPNAGKICVDGTDINEAIDTWQSMLGYIPQTISLMDDTIRNNILFGVRPEDCDEERLVSAMKEAQLYDFVSGLPEGLDTMIGEGGVRLSGGQRQRIGIARALYSRPEVLILDEATSALDNDTETAVMEAIDNLSGSKTLIIIAHRLTTIRNCDIVYRVENGKITIDEEK